MGLMALWDSCRRMCNGLPTVPAITARARAVAFFGCGRATPRRLFGRLSYPYFFSPDSQVSLTLMSMSFSGSVV